MGVAISDENLDELDQLNLEIMNELLDLESADRSVNSQIPPELFPGFLSTPFKSNLHRRYKLPGLPPGSEYGPYDIEDLDGPGGDGIIEITDSDSIKSHDDNRMHFSTEIIFELGCNADFEVIPPKDKTFDLLLALSGLLMNAEMRQVALGDVEEQYNQNVAIVGESWAKIYILWDFLVSVIPLVYAFVSGLFIKALKFAGLHQLLKFLYEKFSGS